MKIVQIIGGLGNQMFQYAFLVALREHFKQELLMDISLFDTYSLHNGFELSKIFRISAKRASDSDVHKLYHRFFTHSYMISKLYRHCFPKLATEERDLPDGSFNKAVMQDGRDLYYVGDWQNYQYFAPYTNVIKEEFRWKEVLNIRNQLFLSSIEGKKLCSIHVRRGDYVNHPTYQGICDEKYYRAAIEIVLERFHGDIDFLIFSNDMDWCRQHIAPLINPNSLHLVNWNKGRDSYKDMRLMTYCDANIIANSSFSWWGAFLNQHDNKVVVSPRKWVNIEKNFEMALPEWETI